jgi:hypothetical protein
MARTETPEQFAASLLSAAAEAPVRAVAVVKRGANNIKTGARANVAKSAPVHNAHAQYAITYDEPSIVGGLVQSEIGYDKDIKGGSLGNLLEYGGAGDRSPAHRDIGRAADAEEATLGDFLQAMAVKLL